MQGGGGNRPIIIVHPTHHRPSSYRMVHMEGRVFKNLGEEQSCHRIKKGVSFLGTRLLWTFLVQWPSRIRWAYFSYLNFFFFSLSLSLSCFFSPISKEKKGEGKKPPHYWIPPFGVQTWHTLFNGILRIWGKDAIAWAESRAGLLAV
jgi:hypothetical protein